MIIRTEEPKDYKQVYELNYHAFNKREDESKLIEKIRSSESFIPELSIVAAENDRVLGHILISKAQVIHESAGYDVTVLAPIAVLPEYQRQGIGAALINEGLKRCADLDYGLVLLIGHPSYYPKFGFVPARHHGLELKQFKVPDPVFMVCELIDGELNKVKGELQYPKAFFS